MRESLVETLIGLAVVTVATVFLWFAMSEGSDASTSSDTREIGARFSSISGISRGADVRVAGVKVGVVRSLALDLETNEAQVVMSVDQGLSIYEDAVLRIQTDGLLGGAYIALDPGYDAFELGPVPTCGADAALFDGSGCSMIVNTQGSVDLMTLFASFATGGGDSDDSAPAEDPYGYPE